MIHRWLPFRFISLWSEIFFYVKPAHPDSPLTRQKVLWQVQRRSVLHASSFLFAVLTFGLRNNWPQNKIVPILRWRTFRYWAVRAIVVWPCEAGVRVPLGEWHNSSTGFNPQQSPQLISSTNKLPVIFKSKTILNANPKQDMYSYLLLRIIRKNYLKKWHWPPNIF